MFRKYEKTFRILLPEIPLKGRFLKDKEVKSLLDGYVWIEEKLDGANAGIVRHKTGFHLQKRGSLVGQSEHKQFQYFHNWANVQNYDKIMNLPPNYTIYGELMYAKHCIYYDKLPDYFIVYDVFNKKANKYLGYVEKETFCAMYGFFMAPLIADGHFNKKDLYDLIPEKSAFGDVAEGIVVKGYKKNCGYFRGKIVKPEFIKAILENDQHWTRNHLTTNKLWTENHLTTS